MLLAGSGAFIAATAPGEGAGQEPGQERGEDGKSHASLRARFAPEARVSPSSLPPLEAPRPTFEGKSAPPRPGSTGRPAPSSATSATEAGGATSPSSPGAAVTPPSVTVGPDIFVADGSETALAANIADGNNLAGVLNQGYSNSPSLRTSFNGGINWSDEIFPNGAGSFTGHPFDPWAAAGIDGNVLYTSFLRRDVTPGSLLNHAILARSIDAGASWFRIFEASRALAEDRDMLDVDRTGLQGGGPGNTHDGKIYLTYDGFDISNTFVASYLEVLSPAGALLNELTTSSPAQFNGTEMQPVAGTTDGQIYLMSVASSPTGDATYLIFNEVTGAGTGFSPQKSSIGFWTVGQQFGTSRRFGLNGHRTGAQMQMDIDRSNGPRRGALYVVSSRNPNPTDPTQDQGDIYLSVSTDGALSWTKTLLPGLAPGKTQFFGMLDVDDDGWIHVAYYQNETGSTNNGVLNASTANVYYTVSNDGGQTWAPHTQVNAPADSLNYFDPPPDLSQQGYYLIGDYAQVRAATVAGTKVAYVFWTGYNKNRTDIYLYDKRERAICTKVTPQVDTDGDGWFDPQDNCPQIYNPGQEDLNHNGIGDICENWPCRANADNTGSSLGRIDGSDLFPLARAFGSCTGDPAYNAVADLSPQGCVDGYDLALLASVWGESVTCP